MNERTRICDDTLLLSRLWASLLLLLIAVTFPLWFAPPGLPGMPAIAIGLDQVPGLSGKLPSSFFPIFPIALVIGLALIVVSANKYRALWWLVAVCLLASFALDQHRLQPWAYQSAIYALVFAAIDLHQARRLLIPLAASVYIYSAAGKFDYQFVHTVGQDFLDVVLRPLGGLFERWDETDRARLALIFPTVELLCGVGLLIRPTRIVAAIAVIIMHMTLFFALGPWGLDHSNGVLIWNLLLILQAYVLFIKPDWSDHSNARNDAQMESQSPRGHRALSATVFGVVVGALVAPLGERSGYWDHWTSWSLYSPHTSRVDIELHRSGIDKLPRSMAIYLQQDDNEEGWLKLEIEHWSLGARSVPIYPQARYQLALADRIAGQLQLTDEIRVRVRGVSDRWTGRRNEQLLLGRGEIRDALRFYWINGPAPP